MHLKSLKIVQKSCLVLVSDHKPNILTFTRELHFYGQFENCEKSITLNSACSCCVTMCYFHCISSDHLSLNS